MGSCEKPGNFNPHQFKEIDKIAHQAYNNVDFEVKKKKKKWFEAQLEIKKRKSKAASDEPPLKNVFTKSNFNQETDLTCFLQAYSV